MSIAIWLLSLFVLGIVAMALCYLFMEACDKI
jgi:VIT1/CCC1 family predicted Fe2+/Mn2+ transporter